MADIDDLFTPPNAGAYEQHEVRHGPPLTYVAEKARLALYHVHSLCRAIRDLTDFSAQDHTRDVPDRSELVRRADAAFYYALVSFLALYNSLGRLGEWEQQEQKLEALRELSREAFDDWLDSIESEGSVN